MTRPGIGVAGTRVRSALERLGLVVLILAVGGCAAVGWPGGSGAAGPEPDDGPPVADPPTSATAAATALVEAWVRGDEAAADRVSNAGAASQLLKRSPPAAAPALVSCTTAIAVPEAVDCMFAADDGYLVLTASEVAVDEWAVLSVKMRP